MLSCIPPNVFTCYVGPYLSKADVDALTISSKSLYNMTLPYRLRQYYGPWDPHAKTFHGFKRVFLTHVLPDSKFLHGVSHLIFDSAFNQPVEGLQLPASLTYLTFGSCFNQPVERLQLPPTLTHLTFGSDFNHPLKNMSCEPSQYLHVTVSPEYDKSRIGDCFKYVNGKFWGQSGVKFKKMNIING